MLLIFEQKQQTDVLQEVCCLMGCLDSHGFRQTTGKLVRKQEERGRQLFSVSGQ